jgi:hypothetical protein
MMKIVNDKERLRWVQTFVTLYDQAIPVVRNIANLEMLNAGEFPVNTYTVLESDLTLRPIIRALKKMHEPANTELADIQREFKIALSSCIKAADVSIRYIEERRRGHKSQELLNDIINATVLANEYIESVSKRLEIISPKTSDLEAGLNLRPVLVEEQLQQRKILDKGAIPSSERQSVIVKIANCIEYGLDKLGDALIFPIEKTVATYKWMSRTVNRVVKRRNHY